MSESEIVFEDIDSAFDESSVAIEIVPMLSAARNTGVKAWIFMRVGIGALAVLGSSARLVTDRDASGRAYRSDGFMTNPLVSFGAIFAAGDTVESKGSFVKGTDRRAVNVEISMSSAGIAWIDRNANSVKVKILSEHDVVIIGIKGRIGDESLEEFEVRVLVVEIGQYRF